MILSSPLLKNLNTSNVILQSKYGDIPFYADSDLNTSNVILQLDLFWHI